MQQQQQQHAQYINNMLLNNKLISHHDTMELLSSVGGTLSLSLVDCLNRFSRDCLNRFPNSILLRLVRHAGENCSPDQGFYRVLVDIADTFVHDVATASASLAKHRGSDTISIEDVQRHLGTFGCALCVISSPFFLAFPERCSSSAFVTRREKLGDQAARVLV
jgi:histone H3/H4